MQLLSSDDARLAPEWDVQCWFNQPGRPGLADYRGRVVVLHAFQMLCPGCVLHGIPQAQRIDRTFASADVAVIGLHTVFEHHQAMGPLALEAFLHEYRVDFPVGVDAPSGTGAIPATMAAYGMRGTPTLILIDRMGRLRVHAFGRLDDMALGAAIAALLGENARDDELAVPAPAVKESSGCDDACAIGPG